MFSQLMQPTKVDILSLWDQCFMVLRERKGGSAKLEDVNRLALLVSHQVMESYRELIQETLRDPVNGFLEELPFKEESNAKKD